MQLSAPLKTLYSELVDDDPQEAREREKQAFDHAVSLMEAAEGKGPASREGHEALFFLEEFWSILMDDLAQDDSDLPERLRASLISIGIWVLKETGRIRQGMVSSFAGLIEINVIIRDGLR